MQIHMLQEVLTRSDQIGCFFVTRDGDANAAYAVRKKEKEKVKEQGKMFGFNKMTCFSRARLAKSRVDEQEKKRGSAR